MSGLSSATRLLRLFFGVFMIIIYFGMAYLLIINFFDWTPTVFWKAVRYGIAAILAAYGIFRAYRLVKGTDFYNHER